MAVTREALKNDEKNFVDALALLELLEADARLPARRRIKAGAVRNSGDNSDGSTISWR